MKTILFALMLTATLTAHAQQGKTTCKGTTKSGKPCHAIMVGKDGYCRLHTPTAFRCNFMRPDSTTCRMTVKHQGDHCRFHVNTVK